MQTDVDSLCVEPSVHQARKIFLPSGAWWCAAFPAVRIVRFDRVEHPGAKVLDFAQALLHRPSPFCLPLVHHVEEPVAHDGVDMDSTALRTAATALGAVGAAGVLDVGDLLVSERWGDGVSWLSSEQKSNSTDEEDRLLMKRCSGKTATRVNQK